MNYVFIERAVCSSVIVRSFVIFLGSRGDVTDVFPPTIPCFLYTSLLICSHSQIESRTSLDENLPTSRVNTPIVIPTLLPDC